MVEVVAGACKGPPLMRVTRLWVRMKVAPKLGQVGNQVRYLGQGRHVQHAGVIGGREVERYWPGVIPHTLLKWRDRWLWS